MTNRGSLYALSDFFLTWPRQEIQPTSPQDERHAPAALDLNHAHQAEIAEIDFISKRLAQTIVWARVQCGGFRSWQELYEIPGLDATRVAELQRAARIGEVQHTDA